MNINKCVCGYWNTSEDGICEDCLKEWEKRK